jgi:hypothetical protein
MARFLMTIAILVAVYYGLRFVFRFIFPLLLKHWMNRYTRQFDQFSRSDQGFHEPLRKEGEVTITRKENKSSKGPGKDKGEYVDYEEVD